MRLQVQDFNYVKDYIKKVLDQDNRVIEHGKPLSNQEQENVQKLAILFGSLLKDINKNYQKYIIKIINKTHLVLNNSQIQRLTRKYQTNAQLVDQLIRIRRIGQGQIDHNNWAGSGGTHDIYGGNIPDYQDIDVLNLELLYQQLFEHFQFPKQLQKCVINSHQIVYYSAIKEIKTDLNLALMIAEQHLKAYDLGLAIDIKRQQILFPLLDSQYSCELYHKLIKTGQIQFFNFEQFGIWIPKPEPTTFKEWLIKALDLQTVPRASINDTTGLMTNIDYAKDDPECLVKSYRITGLHDRIKW